MVLLFIIPSSLYSCFIIFGAMALIALSVSTSSVKKAKNYPVGDYAQVQYTKQANIFKILSIVFGAIAAGAFILNNFIG